MRIEKSIFQHIEFELYNYKDTKDKLESYREQIIEGTSRPESGVKAGLSDVTGSKAIKLSSSPYILRCEDIIRAVEGSLEQLGDKHKALFKLKYIDNKKPDDIIILTNTSRAGYFRRRKEIVILVGKKLGWIE